MPDGTMLQELNCEPADISSAFNDPDPRTMLSRCVMDIYELRARIDVLETKWTSEHVK